MAELDELICACGHTAHWHGVADGVQGAGECEHDGECPCEWFLEPPDESIDENTGLPFGVPA